MTETRTDQRPVGRTDVLEQIDQLVAALRQGQGGSLWLEGDSGVGKSTTLAAGLATTAATGCSLRWAVADERQRHVPLRPLLDAFGDDGRAAEAVLSEGSPGLWAFGDPVPAAAERLIAVVEDWTTQRPQILVLDDVQWTDEASLRVCWRLARLSRQAPLLVVVSGRPMPGRPEVQRLREAISTAGTLAALGPLAEEEVIELARHHLGRVPGPRLRRFLDAAAGNPLYLLELMDALTRDGSISVGPKTAELAEAVDVRVPPSVIAAVTARLTLLSAPAQDLVRRAAVLGMEFTIVDLTAALGQHAAELGGMIDEATRAGVLATAGARLRFRHPIIQQAIYDDLPRATRLELHRSVGQALANAAAAVERVAPQVLAVQALEPERPDPWAVEWLFAEAQRLGLRAPDVAVRLLTPVTRQLPSDRRTPALDLDLARLLFRLSRSMECVAHIDGAWKRAVDAETRHEMTWIRAATLVRLGRYDDLLSTLEDALPSVDPTSVWRARLLALTAFPTLAPSAKDMDAAAGRAQEALAMGEASHDPFAIMLAAHVLSVIAAYQNDNRAVVAFATRALEGFGPDRYYANLTLIVLHNRLLAWLNLDDTHQAGADLVTNRAFAQSAGGLRLATTSVAAAEYYFRIGRWDDAVAETEALGDDEATGDLIVATYVRRGVGALVAAHRDDWPAAIVHLDAMREATLEYLTERNNAGYLLMARALRAEAEGDPQLAAAVLAPTLDPEFAVGMHLRYLWLPELTRLALAYGDDSLARAAADACAEEVKTESTPGKITAAARCEALISGQVRPLLDAAETYRSLARPLELGQTLEDAAVLLAPDDQRRARQVYAEAVEAYAELGAGWDIRRADVRLRPYGLRRPRHALSGRPTVGWGALSRTELTIAALVAQGLSNSAIAAELFIGRRTVETHVAHVFAKLGASSRAEVARLAAENTSNS